MPKQKRTHGAQIGARFSTGNQNDDSIDVQVDKCTAWCHEHHIPIVGIHADYAVSGMKDTRPQYEQMMGELRQGIGDTVVIYDQSRMFRKLTAWFAFREEMAQLGVTVVSVTQPMVGGNLMDSTNFMAESMIATCNQVWALQSREKTIAKLRYMARHGQHTGGKPALGFRVEDKQLVIDETEAAIVRRAFQAYASGMSYSDIIREFQAKGYRTKRGSPFGLNSLHDLFKNERYIGTLVYGAHAKHKSPHDEERTDVIKIPDALPAIIDRETWDTVQAKMKENKRVQAGHPAQVREYPLKGKIFCLECGCAMCVRRARHDYYYYACSDSRRTKTCDNPPIRIDKLEQTVAAFVRSCLGDPDVHDMAIRTIRQEVEKITGRSAQRLISLQEEAWKCKTQINRCVDAIVEGYATTSIKEKMVEMEQRSAEVERQIQALKKAVEISQLPLEAMEKIFRRFQEAAPEDLDTILQAVTRVEVGKEEIRIYTLFDPNDPNSRDREFATEDAFITIDGDSGGSPIIVITDYGILVKIKR